MYSRYAGDTPARRLSEQSSILEHKEYLCNSPQTTRRLGELDLGCLRDDVRHHARCQVLAAAERTLVRPNWLMQVEQATRTSEIASVAGMS